MSLSYRLFWLLCLACLSRPHLFTSPWLRFNFVMCILCMLLCSQAPISAVKTMETVPSCVSPPPRPPGPACARQDTACAQGSSLARVRRSFILRGEDCLNVTKLWILWLCCRCWLVPAVLCARRHTWYSTGPIRQVWCPCTSVRHVPGCGHRFPCWYVFFYS